MDAQFIKTSTYRGCKVLIPFGLNGSQHLIINTNKKAIYEYHIITNEWKLMNTIKTNQLMKGKCILTSVSINNNHTKLFMRLILKQNELFYSHKCLIYHIANKTIHKITFDNEFKPHNCQAIFTSIGLILFFGNKKNKLFIYDQMHDEIKLFCDI